MPGAPDAAHPVDGPRRQRGGRARASPPSGSPRTSSSSSSGRPPRARAALDRVARSRTLDAVMQPGLGGLDRATFAWRRHVPRRTRPTRGRPMPSTTWRRARCGWWRGRAGGRARVDDPRVTVDARTIDLTLESDAMTADGDVRSLLKAERRTSPAEGAGAPRKRPGMLRDDQPVNVTAQHLEYDSAAGTAVYTGDARLWQGETADPGRDDHARRPPGATSPRRGVRSTLATRRQGSRRPARRRRRRPSPPASDCVYEDARARATYTTNARMNGPEGDLRAVEDRAVSHAEGARSSGSRRYDAVTLRADEPDVDRGAVDVLRGRCALRHGRQRRCACSNNCRRNAAKPWAEL